MKIKGLSLPGVFDQLGVDCLEEIKDLISLHCPSLGLIFFEGLTMGDRPPVSLANEPNLIAMPSALVRMVPQ